MKNMKKILMFAILIVFIIGIYLYISNKQKNENIVKADVEFICFQHINRFTPIQMIEDKVSKEDIKNNIALTSKKGDEIALKYGYKSQEDMSATLSKLLFGEKREDTIKSITNSVRRSCAPEFIFY